MEQYLTAPHWMDCGYPTRSVLTRLAGGRDDLCEASTHPSACHHRLSSHRKCAASSSYYIPFPNDVHPGLTVPPGEARMGAQRTLPDVQLGWRTSPRNERQFFPTPGQAVLVAGPRDPPLCQTAPIGSFAKLEDSVLDRVRQRRDGRVRRKMTPEFHEHHSEVVVEYRYQCMDPSRDLSRLDGWEKQSLSAGRKS